MAQHSLCQTLSGEGIERELGSGGGALSRPRDWASRSIFKRKSGSKPFSWGPVAWELTGWEDLGNSWAMPKAYFAFWDDPTHLNHREGVVRPPDAELLIVSKVRKGQELARRLTESVESM